VFEGGIWYVPKCTKGKNFFSLEKTYGH
jgi:hypothetical protein